MIVNIASFLGVLQLHLGSNGEERRLCYIRKDAINSNICVRPQTRARCCTQELSVDSIDVYGSSTCGVVSDCGSGQRCCESRDILNVSEEYVALIEQAFRRTSCFNRYMHQDHLPATSGLVSVVVSYSCTSEYSYLIIIVFLTTTASFKNAPYVISIRSF